MFKVLKAFAHAMHRFHPGDEVHPEVFTSEDMAEHMVKLGYLEPHKPADAEPAKPAATDTAPVIAT